VVYLLWPPVRTASCRSSLAAMTRPIAADTPRVAEQSPVTFVPAYRASRIEPAEVLRER